MRRVLAVLLVVLASGGVAHASVQPALPLSQLPDDALTQALRQGGLTEAQYVLQRALSAFDYHAVAARFGDVARPGPFDATLLLRDLIVRKNELTGHDRLLAETLLSRPTAPVLARPDDSADPNEHHYDPSVVNSSAYKVGCTPNFCVNWVEASADAPDLTDADADGIPDYINAVFTVMKHVWDTEIGQMGFRAPKNDANSPDLLNSNPELDVYIADIGSNDSGLFGYCTTDDPNADPTSPYPGLDVSAYCVLDNDYAPSQYPGTSGLAALEVTAAHEFFHAVQFAYNAFQDSWLLEGTATWMEDQVYDEVNDNRQYLLGSQLVAPNVPLDVDAESGELSLFKYGTWSFFELLSETFDPSVVRSIIEAGDGTPANLQNSLISLLAIADALKQRGSSLAAMYALYGEAILAPPLFFDEGGDWTTEDRNGKTVHISAPIPSPVKLTSKRSAVSRTARLDHLTTKYEAFAPGKGVRAGAKLTIGVNLPSLGAGSAATIVTVSRSGKLTFVPLTLNSNGDGARAVAFGSTRAIILVLTNGSSRITDCGNHFGPISFTCGGLPLDDGGRFAFNAKLS